MRVLEQHGCIVPCANSDWPLHGCRNCLSASVDCDELCQMKCTLSREMAKSGRFQHHHPLSIMQDVGTGTAGKVGSRKPLTSLVSRQQGGTGPPKILSEDVSGSAQQSSASSSLRPLYSRNQNVVQTGELASPTQPAAYGALISGWTLESLHIMASTAHACKSG